MLLTIYLLWLEARKLIVANYGDILKLLISFKYESLVPKDKLLIANIKLDYSNIF